MRNLTCQFGKSFQSASPLSAKRSNRQYCGKRSSSAESGFACRSTVLRTKECRSHCFATVSRPPGGAGRPIHFRDASEYHGPFRVET